MKTITQEDISGAVRAFNSMSPEDLEKVKRGFFGRQTWLATFCRIVGSHEGLSDVGQRLGLFMTLYAWWVVETTAGAPLPTITVDDLMTAYFRREEWFDGFSGMTESEFSRWLQLTPELPQRVFTTHLIAGMAEHALHGASGLQVDERDQALLAGLLLAVVDALDDKLQEVLGRDEEAD